MKYLEMVDALWPSWHARAACHPDNGHDPETWFPRTPAGGTAASRFTREQATRPAKAICATCPVLDECRGDAVASGATAGIWGEKDFEKPPPKKRTSAACGTDAGYQAHVRRHETACEPCKKARAEAVADRRRSA